MSAPRPVVFAITRSEVGGAQRELSLLLRALDRKAFPPFVLLGEDGPLARTLASLDIRAEVSPASFKSIKGVRHFARVARREKARLLHLCAPRTLAVCARGLGLAVVEVVNLLRSPGAGGWVARPLLDRTLLKLAHLAIVPSRAMEDQLLSRGVPASKLRLVPDGVPFEEASRPREAVRESLGVPPGFLLLLCIGRLVRVKGQDVLLRAFAQARPSLPSTVLLLAGEGEERPALESLARDLGVAGSVRFLGNRSDVRDLLEASDLVAQASRAEVLANAVLETMVASRAIVATDAGGTKEAVIEGETGLLVPPEDAPALARALVALANDPARREAMGKAARARVERERSLDAMARSTEAVYREALAKVRSHA
ncbi:glycosyltransferase [bacterium]|nr:glycosyltransferase [bacterium]